MNSNYPKTAKDLAWDKERRKLKSEIFRLKQELNEKDSLIDAQLSIIKQHQEEISRLDSIIEQLKETLDLSPEDVKILVENKKKQNEAVDMFNALRTGGIGNMFYI